MAQPNDAHHALARLEAHGRCQLLLTQNVDRLHQAAGSREVIDLHGRLDLVRCMACSTTIRRADFQDQLIRLNAAWGRLDAAALPDGDADLDGLDFSAFAVPPCERCGGVLKPDVVFYGENVPRDAVAAAHSQLEAADAMLIVGSSLMSIPAIALPWPPRAAVSRSLRSTSAGRAPMTCLRSRQKSAARQRFHFCSDARAHPGTASQVQDA